MKNIVSLPTPLARLSQKLQEAIRLTVVEGLSIVAACERAGMSRQGYHKAMKRASVRDHLHEVQRRFVMDTDARKAFLRAQALDVALDLMLNSKSEAIRARIVEFLAGDAKVSPVAVHIDARHAEPPFGYSYPRIQQELDSGD